ncbi:hypothetical protein F3H11_36185, partial [Pseudomonas aeruginosa]
MNGSSVVLLATANVEVRDSSGHFHTLRALIDPGSLSHFISNQAMERLGLKPKQTSRNVCGLGQSSTSVTGMVELQLGVHQKNLFNLTALILPSICAQMPTARLDLSSCEHLRNLRLADPNYNKPGPLDL